MEEKESYTPEEIGIIVKIYEDLLRTERNFADVAFSSHRNIIKERKQNLSSVLKMYKDQVPTNVKKILHVDVKRLERICDVHLKF